MIDEIIYQEHTYVLFKQPDFGFGIAISGGKDNPGVQSGDTSIIISDVVKQGPAFNKLQINDTVLRVNGRPTYGMTHQQAVRELKNAGTHVEIVVKRKALVRVDRRGDTPSPGALRRHRSRDFDSRGRRGSRDYSPRRYRSHSRDLERSSRSRHHHSRGREYSRSRSRSVSPPARRSRSYSRSRSRSSRRSRHRSPTPSSRSSSRSPPRGRRSRSRGRSRSRSRERSRSRRRSPDSVSSRSESPPVRTPKKHRSVGDLRSMSPLSPDPPDTKHSDDMMVFPVKPSEPKTVVLKKTRWNNSYGLKLGTRIFIQDIQPGSLAEKNPELRAGDTILMINGRNVDNKSVQEAIQIIGLSKDKLTMLVKKEEGGTVSIPAARFASPSSPATGHKPTKPTERDNVSTRSQHSSPSRESVHSRQSSKSLDKKFDEPAQAEPKAEQKPSKKTVGGIRVMPEELSAAAVASAKKNRSPSSGSSNTGSHRSYTPEPAPRAAKATPLASEKQPLYDVPPEEDDGHILPHDARTITFIKGRNVGIRLAGGNDVGIFVASVQEGSPAAKQGLKAGDQILSVNDTNFRNIIREEAVLTLMGLPNEEKVNIVAQPRPDAYKNILEHGTGDSFYIRTHFKYERQNAHEMSFKQGSVFRVSDTLYQGMVGYWLAVRIGRTNMEIERGVIPNGSRAQQLKEVQDKKIQQTKEKASSRGGIRRRLAKGEGKGKNEKSSSNSPHFPAYERVVLREAGFKRPVVAFGPLADIARQRLASDFPTTYEIAGNEGMLSGQKSNRKGIIRLNTIKDIIEKDKHAILDITPTAVEKLNYAQLYPIVVFLKPESKAAVKELRNKLAITEDEKRKKPGKLYDRAVKMQKGYSHVCTDIISLSSVSDDWYRKLHSTIKDQQTMPVWVSEDKLGGTAEEDTEGVMVPGDDDRLSYVSAPASDYSVTTIGSDMMHSTADYDDDDDDFHTKDIDTTKEIRPSGALMPPTRNRKPSSSSSEEEETGNKFGDDDLDDALNNEFDEGPPSSKPVPPGAYAADSDDATPEAPPRGKKHSASREHHDDTSSTSSEERRPVGARPTPMVAAAASKPPEPSRTLGNQSIPEGRFDPQSFLQNHIKRLKQVKAEEPKSPPQGQTSPRSPRHDERIAPPVAAPLAHTAPPKREPSPEPPENTGRYPQPQSYSRPGGATREPVYAQVNKKRPGVGPQSYGEPPGTMHDDVRRDQRESAGRDYASEIDRFVTAGAPQRHDARPTNTRPPVRDEPQPQAPSGGPPSNSYQQQNSYNRFAGSNKPMQPPKNQYQPYSSNKPSTYRNPMSNGPPPGASGDGPPKSRFVQDKYKDYMQQIRHAETKPASYNAYNPRPFNKSAAPPSVVSKFKNGPVKDQMYDSGVDTYDNAKPKLGQPEPVPVSPSSVDDDDPQVVATARGVFDSNGGVLSSVETGVSIMIPKGAIPSGVKQEIYFKVCKDNTVLPPLDKDKGETLLSPLVMCGPHGLQFNHPVELRLPHCEPSQWQNMNMPSDSNYQVSSNSVSVLIDHF